MILNIPHEHIIELNQNYIILVGICWTKLFVSKSMIPLIVRKSLKIITECGKESLYTKQKYPNANISDHFPIMCEFDIL